MSYFVLHLTLLNNGLLRCAGLIARLYSVFIRAVTNIVIGGNFAPAQRIIMIGINQAEFLNAAAFFAQKLGAGNATIIISIESCKINHSGLKSGPPSPRLRRA